MDDLDVVVRSLDALGLSAVIHSTHSNAPPDDVRFRVVVPLAHPVPRDQWGDVWQRVNATVFGGQNDAQTRDPSRMYYLPTAPPDAPVFTRVLHGAPLDPDMLPAQPERDGQTVAPGTRPDSPPLRIEPIVRGCAWLRHCRDDAQALSEPEWYAMLSIVGRCENGVQLAHAFSAPYPTYSREETDAKLRHALDSAGPRTCADIRQQLGGEPYCQVCPAWGIAASPISFGHLGPVAGGSANGHSGTVAVLQSEEPGNVFSPPGRRDAPEPEYTADGLVYRAGEFTITLVLARKRWRVAGARRCDARREYHQPGQCEEPT